MAVDGFVDESAQDAGDGELDGAAVFEKGNVKGIDQADGLFGGPVQLRVEVAKGFVPEGVGAALLAGRHDVPTCGFHSLLLCAPTTPPLYAVPPYLETKGLWA